MRHAASLLVSLSLFATACAHSYGPPAPPLPPPPAPIAAPAPSPPSAQNTPSSGPSCLSATGPDPELSALRIGFCGCRVMGLRLDPAMSGRAILRATVGMRGEVDDVAPVTVEGLPATVVRCLVDRVRHTRFSPRAATMLVTIPVSFENAGAPATPTNRVAPLPAGSVDL